MGTPGDVSAQGLSPEEKSHPTGSPSSKQPTWNALVKDSSSLIRTFNTSFETSNGIAIVDLPSEVLEDAVPLWRNFIIGHFIGDVPYIGKVHAIVNKIWASPDSRIDVQFISKTAVLFRIENDVMRSRVLKRHHWHIAEIPIVVSEWKPETASKSLDLESIPIWVDFAKVPGELFTHKGLSFLASIVGTPIKLHPKTERCTRLAVARLLVEVNLKEPLPSTINVHKKSNEKVDVAVSYPWLPPRCTCFNKWGHVTSSCNVKKPVVILEKQASIDCEKQSSSELVKSAPLQVVEEPAPFTSTPSKGGWTTIVKSPKTKSVVKAKDHQHEGSQKNLSQKSRNSNLGEHSSSPSRFSVLADIEEGEMVESIEAIVQSKQVPTKPLLEVAETEDETPLEDALRVGDVDFQISAPNVANTVGKNQGGTHRKRSKNLKPIVSKKEQGPGQNPRKASNRKL